MNFQQAETTVLALFELIVPSTMPGIAKVLEYNKSLFNGRAKSQIMFSLSELTFLI